MKYKKNKKIEASILVVSLVIISIILISSLSIVLVAGQERRGSIGASKTGSVFQSADKLVELTMNEIQWGNHKVVSGLLDEPSSLKEDADFSCANSGLLVNNSGYKIQLLKSTETAGVFDQIDCDESISLGDVARFKVSVTTTQIGRAIEANVDCNIRNCQQLQNISQKPDGYYCLAKSEINCEGVAFEPINNFSGVFDGRGNKITNLKISSDGSAGLFGNVINDARVQNIGITEAGIRSDSGDAGILIGEITEESSAVISNCYTSGKVAGGKYAGGLIGNVDSENATIEQSYSKATVTGKEAAGGLVGYNKISITDSYATGLVGGNNYSGGLVGYNDSNGSIENSYYGGTVNGGVEKGGLIGYNNNATDPITDSYYDVTKNSALLTCGEPLSVCSVAGKTTANLSGIGTYQNWDFSYTWQINNGTSYPCFLWEGDFTECPLPIN